MRGFMIKSRNCRKAGNGENIIVAPASGPFMFDF